MEWEAGTILTETFETLKKIMGAREGLCAEVGQDDICVLKQ